MKENVELLELMTTENKNGNKKSMPLALFY